MCAPPPPYPPFLGLGEKFSLKPELVSTSVARFCWRVAAPPSPRRLRPWCRLLRVRVLSLGPFSPRSRTPTRGFRAELLTQPLRVSSRSPSGSPTYRRTETTSRSLSLTPQCCGRGRATWPSPSLSPRKPPPGRASRRGTSWSPWLPQRRWRYVQGAGRGGAGVGGRGERRSAWALGGEGRGGPGAWRAAGEQPPWCVRCRWAVWCQISS